MKRARLGFDAAGILALVATGGAVWSQSPGKPLAAPKAVAVPSDHGASHSPALPAPMPIDATVVGSRWASWLESPARDPFQVLALGPLAKDTTQVSPISHLKLSATWLQSGGRYAIVNQRVWGEGDDLEGYTIVRIDRDRVVLQGPERNEEITFGSYVPPPAATPVSAAIPAFSGTNRIDADRFLGPEKQKVRY